MDIRLLKIFSAVAKHGALPSASRELHLTASALSHGLKALESELGVRLFDRVGRRLVLNQAGEQLLAQIQQPLAALEKAAVSVKALGQWGQGRLRVGAPATLCQHVLPAVIRELHQAFPKLMVIVESGDGRHLLDLLSENQIDLALTVEPEQAPGMELTAAFEDELLYAFSDQHPWADGRCLDAQEVGRQPLMLLNRATVSGRLVQRFFDHHGITPNALMEIGSLEMIRELVKLSVAVAVLPPWLFDQELTTGSVQMRPLASKGLKRCWTIVHRAQRCLALPEEQFIKIFRRQVTSLRLDRRDLPPAAKKNERGCTRNLLLEG
jgi:LysR family transcriptional regulator, low CO2-responsive transcriptional regulator